MKRHIPTVVVVAACLMFIVSFFLPVSNVLEQGGTPPGTPLSGWQTFMAALQMTGYPFTFLLIPQQPQILLLLTFPFINLVMLLAPVVVLAWDDSWLLSGLFLLCGLVPWFLPKDITGDLFVGFYLWDGSFFAMAAGCLLVSICRRTEINKPTCNLK